MANNIHSSFRTQANAAFLKSHWMYSLALGLLILFFATSIAQGAIQFSDQTTAAGITHVSAFPAASDTGGGAGWIDYDNDGYQDLYVPNPYAGGASWLYHNNGNGTFTERAAAAGVQNSAYPSTGIAIGDYNGDGWDDIFVTNGINDELTGNRRNTLFRNNGNGTFTDVTSSVGLTHLENSMVASFGDLDNDGDLDLYVGNYHPNGSGSTSAALGYCQSNSLYRNNSGTSFTKMSGASNVGCTLATMLTDFDDDGDLDIYVSNDFSGPSSYSLQSLGTPDTIYRNNGNLSFTALSSSINLADAQNGMGIAMGDYGNDRDWCYYTTTMSTLSATGSNINVLNQNQLANGGGAVFLEIADQTGIADRGNGTIGPIVGWGAVSLDADKDGRLDLYKANGRIGDPFISVVQSQANRLYHNIQGSSWADIAASTGLDGFICTHGSTGCNLPYDQSRGVAAADYDNDGDVDLFVVNNAYNNPTAGLVGGAPRLYRNDTTTSNRWLRVKLIGKNPNHRGIGATIRATTPDGTTQQREIHSGSSHGSTHDSTVSFGLGINTTVSTLTVNWPRGCEQTVAGVGSNTTVTVDESQCVSTANPPFFAGDGVPGDVFYFFGTNLLGASNLTINGVPADITINFTNAVAGIIPAGASTGLIFVDTPYTQDLFVGQYLLPEVPELAIGIWFPYTSSLTTIKGDSFFDITGVLLNGVDAAFFSPDPQTINVIGPAWTIHTVQVNTATGSIFKDATPSIVSVVPFSQFGLSWTLITGINFDFGIRAFTVDGRLPWAVQINVDDPNQIYLVEPYGSFSTLSITTDHGTAVWP